MLVQGRSDLAYPAVVSCRVGRSDLVVRVRHPRAPALGLAGWLAGWLGRRAAQRGRGLPWRAFRKNVRNVRTFCMAVSQNRDRPPPPPYK